MGVIKEATISKRNYLWDAFPISEIDKGTLYIQSPSHLDKLVSLYRKRDDLKPYERHRGTGWILLKEEKGHLEEGRELFTPNLEDILSDGLPKRSYWCGTIVKNNDQYYAFLSISEYNNHCGGWDQKIGLAISSDLNNWTTTNETILEPDNRLYQHLKGFDKTGKAGAFRDPFVFPTKEGYGMIFAARDMEKRVPYNGCVGYATSENLIDWHLKEPILSPSISSEMEVPQLIKLPDGRHLLIVSVHEYTVREAYKEKYPLLTYLSEEGTHFRPLGEGYLLNLPGEVYSVRCLSVKGNKIHSIAFYNKGELEGSITPTFDINIGKSLSISPKDSHCLKSFM